MNILIIGSGGREHALVWKLKQSPSTAHLFAYPGNAGTAGIAENIPAPAEDPGWSQLIRTCRTRAVDWVFVGPEQPLTEGVVDALQQAGIPAFGPHASAARLEGSKSFSKDFMLRNGIPTASAATVTNPAELDTELKKRSGMVVLKKSGLAAGKGVLESDDPEELRDFGKRMLDDDTLVVEDYLEGYEVSLFTLGNGRNFLLLPPCADYKKAGDGNTGLNTGGMGAVSPVPWLPEDMFEQTVAEIVEPTHTALQKEGLAYTGVLYFGIMVTPDGPKLLEYNVRFGDPEAQILLPRIQGDFAAACKGLLEAKLIEMQSSTDSAVTVVAAAPGYPGGYPKRIPARIAGSDSATGAVIHASTLLENAVVLTNGGRCFTATGWGHDTQSARTAAYKQLERIDFDGMWYRRDIGTRVRQQAKPSPTSHADGAPRA